MERFAAKRERGKMGVVEGVRMLNHVLTNTGIDQTDLHTKFGYKPSNNVGGA